MIKIREISTEFKNWVNKYEEMENKIYKMNFREIQLHGELEEENQKFYAQQQINKNDDTCSSKLIDERVKEFQNIHAGLVNINKMYVDLNIIINAQQKILENIHCNIVKADDFIKKSTTELKSAAKESKKGSKLGIVMAVTAGVTFVLTSFGLAKS